MSESRSIHEEASKRIDAIIEEMKARGFWQDEPLPPEALDFQAAFGADKLSFFQWLQFVLVERVRETVAEGGNFPGSSSVGAYALRELDGLDEAAELISRLCHFDALFREADEEPAVSPAAPRVDPTPPPEPGGADENVFAVDPTFAVRGFLIGTQNGMPEAARARVTRATAASPGFDPKPPFEIESFETEAPEHHADCAVVRATIRGKDPTGAPIEHATPFVLLHEDGEWKIDMERTMGMMFTGNPSGGAEALESAMGQAMEQMAGEMSRAMEGMADAMGQAFSSFSEEMRAEQQEQIERFRVEVWTPALAEALGRDLELVIDMPAEADGEIGFSGLDDLLQRELPVAFRMARSEVMEILRPRIDRVRVGFAARAADRRFQIEGGELLIIASTPMRDDWLGSTLMAFFLEFEANADHSERWRELFVMVRERESALAESHDLWVQINVEWFRLQDPVDALVTSWNIYLMATKAFAPLMEALEGVLTAEPELLESARQHLGSIGFERTWGADEQAVAGEYTGIVYRAFLEETFTGNWTAAELGPRVSQALRDLFTSITAAGESDGSA